jgi:hypothetical protein
MAIFIVVFLSGVRSLVVYRQRYPSTERGSEQHDSHLNRPNVFYPFYVNPNMVDKDRFSPIANRLLYCQPKFSPKTGINQPLAIN